MADNINDAEGGEEEEQVKSFDWSAFYDDEGRIYYYNSVTDESAWDPPEEGFNPPEEEQQPPIAEESAADAAIIVDVEEEEGSAENAEPQAQAETPAEEEQDETAEEVSEAEAAPEAGEVSSTEGAGASGWVLYKDDEGQEYYYNTVTGETQWDKPEGVEVMHGEDVIAEGGGEEEEGESQEEQEADEPTEGPPSPSAEFTTTTPPYDDTGTEDRAMEEDKQVSEVEEEGVAVQVEEEEEMIDPAVKRLQDAQTALNQPDSILEPDCWRNVNEVVIGSEGNPQAAISALIESYQGQTAICGLLARWLADMRTSSSSSSTSSTDGGTTLALSQELTIGAGPSETTANQIRQLCQDVVNKIAKERFSKESGDAILNLSKSEAAFLEDMMDSPRWRRLLIDLSASHKNSAVLSYCLKAISKRGHHREIAKRINQSDHYAVFNAMLGSELSVIARLAVSAGSDAAASVGMEELVNDLQRACSATSYTYLYSVELLRYLAHKTREELEEEQQQSSSNSSPRFARVLRKWEALVQDLESAMMDPSSSASVAGSSPLFRKRRLEVALTISDLYQRQRKRRRDLDSDHPYQATEEDRRESPLESALLELLRRHAVGIQIGDSILDPLLPQGLDLDTADMTGKLLIHHPLAIRAILGYLYKPGSTRISTPVVKNKCARLVAFAVLAAEKAALDEHDYDKNGATDATPEASDEVALTRMILDGSELVEQLESMVSFLVTIPNSAASSSPGQKLVSLAIKCAAVAQGVILWAREFTRGEFVGSASYPTLSVSILSLVRIVSLEQPFTRRDALDIAMSFLSHSNSDVSYQKAIAIKEQSLRLLLFLLVNGEIASVLGAVAAALKGQGSGSSSGLDASLVRYFIGGMVEIVRPPVSLAFVRAVDAVLRSPRCLDAVRSSYFSEPHRVKLTSLLKSFEDIRARDGKPLAPEDAALIAALIAAYKVD